MTKFIVETDLGHDPDDFLAICHLLAAGHQIVALSIVPGSMEQVAVANLIRSRTMADFSIGVAKSNAKPEHVGVHDKVLKSEGFHQCDFDGDSAGVISAAIDSHPDAEILVIGPGIGLQKAIVGRKVSRLTFQGGFLPYTLHSPRVRLEKFESKTWMPTFNFNGARGAVDAVLAAEVGRKQFVGKNVCHTITLDRERFAGFAQARCEASRLYRLLVQLYLEKHDEKKLHDPVAMVCHLHPEIGEWFPGQPRREGGGWTTVPGDGLVLADIDRDSLWKYLANWR